MQAQGSVSCLCPPEFQHVLMSMVDPNADPGVDWREAQPLDVAERLRACSIADIPSTMNCVDNMCGPCPLHSKHSMAARRAD